MDLVGFLSLFRETKTSPINGLIGKWRLMILERAGTRLFYCLFGGSNCPKQPRMLCQFPDREAIRTRRTFQGYKFLENHRTHSYTHVKIRSWR